LNYNNDKKLESRKAEHVKLVIENDVSVKGTSNAFEYFDLVPRSIPDINYQDISTEVGFLNNKFSAPILVAGMTGGYPEARKLNLGLARICANLGIPLGVGSQRAMIINHKMTSTFNVKEKVSDIFLIGNLGLVQFCNEFQYHDYLSAVENIAADAMAIHINAFQEVCQPEGDLNFSGAWDWLAKLCKKSPVPVIAKEVGSGISWEEVVRMEKIGCSAVDIGGSGGTSWPKIEIMRHNSSNPPFDLDDPTLKWGIPTAFATWEATQSSDIPIISTGGMNHGLMAAKALAMGASMVGIARPVLKALIEGGEGYAEKWLNEYITTIKRVMFLMGVDTIDKLRQQKERIIPHGHALEWLQRRKKLHS
jgi:isopentenyl-diphosphate delta-isomerase